MKFYLFFITIILVFSSCLKEDNYHYKVTDFVYITEVNIPDSCMVYDTLKISAIATETNGCWRDLHFDFSEKSDTSYSLAAYGIFESYGSCPDEIVSIDTLIKIIPTIPTKHIFYVARDAYTLQTDTVTVRPDTTSSK